MAERTLAGQDFGNGIVKAGFDILAPGMAEASITEALDVCWEQSANREKSLDHFTGSDAVCARLRCGAVGRWRSLARGRPPCGHIGGFGNRDSTRSHNSSVRIAWLSFISSDSFHCQEKQSQDVYVNRGFETASNLSPQNAMDGAGTPTRASERCSS